MLRYVLLCLIMVAPLHASVWVKEDYNTLNVSDFSRKVFTLSYIIVHVEPVIKILETATNKEQEYLAQEVIKLLEKENNLKDKRIEQCLKKIKQKKSLKPFFIAWELVSSYKIELQKLDKEYIIELNKILLYCLQQHIISKKVYIPAFLLSSCKDIARIKYFSEIALKYNKLLSIFSKAKDKNKIMIPHWETVRSTKQKREYPLDEMRPEEFAFRFYLINRLKESLTIFKELQNKNVEIFKKIGSYQHFTSLGGEKITFTNKIIKQTFFDLKRTHDIRYFSEIIDHFIQFDFSDDVYFTYDLLLLLCLIYKDLLFYSFSRTECTPIINTKDNRETTFTFEQLLASVDTAVSKIQETVLQKRIKEETFLNKHSISIGVVGLGCVATYAFFKGFLL